MSLIYDDDGVRSEKKVSLNLPQQDSVSHELDLCPLCNVPLVPAGKVTVTVWRAGVGGDRDSPYLVADNVSRDSQLLGHSLGHGGCRHSPGLRHAYPGVARVAGFVQKLGQLCGLSAARLT